MCDEGQDIEQRAGVLRSCSMLMLVLVVVRRVTVVIVHIGLQDVVVVK